MPHRYVLGSARSGHPLVAGALAAALIGLAACSAGDPSSPEGGPAGPALEAKRSYSDDDLRHFLVRTEFGVTNASLNAVRSQGVPAYIQRILAFPSVGEPAFEQQARTILNNSSDPPGFEGRFPSKSQLVLWWLRLIQENPNPFQEVMALFWHGHFSVGSQELRQQVSSTTHWMVDHVDLLRGQAVGNVRQMLIDVSRDRAMLQWLDGITNARLAPNENFAREFWELYTLGVDNGYTQADITEAARAFTGYLGTPGPNGLSITTFYPGRHDSGTKTFLGATLNGKANEDEFEEVVDITLQNGRAAEFLCTKLFEFLCYEDPEAAIVDELASILRDNNWELKPVLDVLLQSNAFYSPQARLGLVKSPIEHAFGFARSTGMRVPLVLLEQAMWTMGQVPTQPPTVEGWPGGSFWLGTQDTVERANFIAASISARNFQAMLGFSWEPILPPSGQRSAANVVDALVSLLFIQPTAQERDDYIDYLNTQRLELGGVVSSPFTASTQQLDERVRGLLYILAQHPTYMTR